jgi:hypothetical protein
MDTTQNNQPLNAAGPPPEAILMQMLFGPLMQQSICVATKLKIADMVAKSPKTVTELANQTKVQEDALYRVLRMLASAGIFIENRNREFGLTPMASLLRSDVPNSLYNFAIMMGEDWLWQNWGELMHCVKTGETAHKKVHGIDSFKFFAENKEAGNVFNNAMTNFSESVVPAVVEAYDFSGFDKLVDIAGGYGFTLAGILKANQQLKGILFDLSYVIKDAKEFMGKEDVINRVELVAGDFFQSVPAGADAYIMKHIIHDWNDELCVKILQNIGSVMNKKGKVLIVEMVVPEINLPSPAKMLDLQMLVMEGGKERTKEEFQSLLKTAGFNLTNIHPTKSPCSIIEGELI